MDSIFDQDPESREARDELGRVIWQRREEREAEQRRRATNYHDDIMAFANRRRFAREQHMLSKDQMNDFSERVLGTANANIYAHDKPTRTADRLVKSYIHGLSTHMFQFCHEVSRNSNQYLSVDEMIPYTEPVRLFFDLEVKIGFDYGIDFFSTQMAVEKYMKVMVPHVKGSVRYAQNMLNMQGYNPPEERVKSLCQAYYIENCKEFDEEMCLAGAKVLIGHTKKILQRLIETDIEENDNPWDEIYVTSGCRSDKFSLHMVFNRILCDRSYLSAPIIVHEIARHWTMMNTVWFMWGDNLTLWSTAEGRFRLHCLMIDKLMNPTDRFYGHNDSVFDEGVYGPRHMLRLPGAAKSDGQHPLHPIVIPNNINQLSHQSPRMMVTENNFDQWFPRTQQGFNWWAKHTVKGSLCSSGNLLDNRVYIFSSWKPPRPMIGDRSWSRRENEYSRTTSRFRLTEVRTMGYKTVSQEGKPEYVEYRKSVKVPLTQEERDLYGRGIDWTTEQAQFDPNTEFLVQGTGRRVPFHDIADGEMIHHRHHGEIEESTASASVWKKCRRSGFFCHTCQVNYNAKEAEIPDLEDRFLFQKQQERVAKNGENYIGDPDNDNDIKWQEWLEKKWAVIDAPMGSGKTEQLANLMRVLNQPCYERKRVLVVTFRVALAHQMSKRLLIKCYKAESGQEADQKELDKAISTNQHDKLVICINSLHKIGSQPWDVVIFDECGLIRLHCLAPITTPQLNVIFPNFISIIKDADNVILAQEFVSEKDVEFYMAFDDADDPYDNRTVNAFRFIKPIHIHPIGHSKDLHASILRMLKCYDEAFDHSGRCIKPFMIFVTKVSMAELLLHLLTEECEKKFAGNDDLLSQNKSRIKGCWRAMRSKTVFAREFLMDPNENSWKADVVIATSIIGAGFSIETQFTSFHAFMTVDVIDHWSQRQFIQRLRTLMRMINGHRPQAQQSYLYTQEGRGTDDEMRNYAQLVDTLMKKFNDIRAEIVKRAVKTNDEISQHPDYIKQLERTQATVFAREEVTREKNDILWEQYSTTLASPFNSSNDDEFSSDEKMEISHRMHRFSNQYRKDVVGMLMTQMKQNENELLDSDPMTVIDELNETNMRDIMIAAASQVRFENWNQWVISTGTACEIIRQKYAGVPSREITKRDNEISKPDKLLTNMMHLACWMCYCYKELGSDEEGSLVFDTFYKKRYATKPCRMASGLMLASHLIPDILAGMERCDAVVEFGSAPFYIEARVSKFHDGWADFWRKRFMPDDNDSAAICTRKNIERRLLGLTELTRQSNVEGSIPVVTKRWTDIKKEKDKDEKESKKRGVYPAFTLFSDIMKYLGLELMSTRSDGVGKLQAMCSDNTLRDAWRVNLTKYDLALVFLLKPRYVERVRAMLPEIMLSDNLGEGGKKLVRDARKLHNECVQHMIGENTQRDEPERQISAQTAWKITIPAIENVHEMEYAPQAEIRRREMLADERRSIEEDQIRQSEEQEAVVAANALSITNQTPDTNEEEFEVGSNTGAILPQADQPVDMEDEEFEFGDESNTVRNIDAQSMVSNRTTASSATASTRRIRNENRYRKRKQRM